MRVNGVTQGMLKNMTFVHTDADMRAYLEQEGVTDYARKNFLCNALVNARDKAKSDAIKNLARYKFSNFGYHAARWVTLNHLIGDKQGNPFKQLVEKAREMSESADNSK